MGEFRTVEQTRALPDLRPQEEELLEKAEAGEFLTLGDGELPSAGDETRSIRAGIIRYLLLGGCQGLHCHERGVQIKGARVPDQLDLTGCDSGNALTIEKSRLLKTLNLVNACLGTVQLDGTYCPGIEAEGLRLRADLCLRNGFRAIGTVNLLGAEIGGNLDLDGGMLNPESDIALFGDGLRVGGDIFLQENFFTTGEVRLVGAHIGGDLSCAGGAFVNEKGCALNAANAKIVCDFSGGKELA